MSERAPTSHEHTPDQPEHEPRHDIAEQRNERAETPHSTEKKQTDLESIKKSIETHAISGKETTLGEHQPISEPVIGTQRELKAEAYDRTLSNVRRKLRPSARAFSKLVHQPTIESVSNVAASTAGRPSGLLGGGIVALLGSGFVLFMSKHYGFRYNFLVFIALFFAGFVAGLVLEFILRLVKRPSR